METKTEFLKQERPEEENKIIPFISYELWFECPVCGNAGQKKDLVMFGRSCCRKFIMEFDEAV